MNDLESREQRLNQMVLEGKALDAFEEFYAEDVVMVDGPDQKWAGKDTNREREKDFFGKVTELRDMDVEVVAVDPDDRVTFSIWHFDYTHEEWGDVKYDQVAVREWDESGRITRERFFKMT